MIKLYSLTALSKDHTNENKNKSRFEPIERDTITHIYIALRNSEYIKERYNALELALTVSIQLQQYEHMHKIEKQVIDYTRKTTAQKLREIADSIQECE
jgi:hypothetical protein